jgi:hypothetical protein
MAMSPAANLALCQKGGFAFKLGARGGRQGEKGRRREGGSARARAHERERERGGSERDREAGRLVALPASSRVEEDPVQAGGGDEGRRREGDRARAREREREGGGDGYRAVAE